MMDRNLALESVRITEAAALYSARWMGKGDGKAADRAATEAMRMVLNSIDIDGKIVIGLKTKDSGNSLRVGDSVGSGKGPEVDIAVDPLECTNSVAFGRSNAMAVLAVAPKGEIMQVPDIYMEKIAVGKQAANVIDISVSIEENLERVAKAKGYAVSDLTIAILDRERHEELIQRVRKAGARIHLIGDGDVASAIASALPGTGIDMLAGTGGAYEGIIAAVALKCIGGEIQGKLICSNNEEVAVAREMGILDINKVLKSRDMARGENVMFTGTGVTDGDLLNGVRYRSDGATTHSLVLRSASGTRRFIVTEHYFEDEPRF